ncbi:RPM1-interacting protein 4-like isoform X2 [Hibiscus syriacus]|uniref:RPM1-interacting protein 4-like isoform X2 n=1 Tax=Hibiscus syriacus TaxID=106335 RepID=A0A6A3CCF6_HIBSY|nr:RPM1-interacting protein 4-like isoform X2 [Hibiscus syriacus]
MSDENKGRPLPKFGEWDVNDPASAEGFTVIFNKARDEKKTGAKPDPAANADTQNKPRTDPGKPQQGCAACCKAWLLWTCIMMCALEWVCCMRASTTGEGVWHVRELLQGSGGGLMNISLVEESNLKSSRLDEEQQGMNKGRWRKQVGFLGFLLGDGNKVRVETLVQRSMYYGLWCIYHSPTPQKDSSSNLWTPVNRDSSLIWHSD